MRDICILVSCISSTTRANVFKLNVLLFSWSHAVIWYSENELKTKWLRTHQWMTSPGNNVLMRQMFPKELFSLRKMFVFVLIVSILSVFFSEKGNEIQPSLVTHHHLCWTDMRWSCSLTSGRGGSGRKRASRDGHSVFRSCAGRDEDTSQYKSTCHPPPRPRGTAASTDAHTDL